MIALEPYRRRLGELQQDATLDAAWNELRAAVEEAWCWRDPESLVVVATCLARLGPHVLRDWS